MQGSGVSGIARGAGLGFFRSVRPFLRKSKGMERRAHPGAYRYPHEANAAGYRPEGFKELRDTIHNAQEMALLRDAHEQVRAHLSRMPRGAPQTPDEFRQVLPHINVLKGEENCAEIALAVDRILAGHPVVAGLSGPTLVRTYMVRGPETIEQTLLDAGHGARGMVCVFPPAGSKHQYNAVNFNGEVSWINVQLSLSGRDAVTPTHGWSEPGTEWGFVRTN